jgi:hypothetical protein
MKPTATLLEPQKSSSRSARCDASRVRHGMTRIATMLCVVWSAGLGACAMSRGWMPAVVLGASVSRAQSDVASGSSGAWNVSGDVAVAWLPTPPESHLATRRRPAPAPLRGAPCASPALCLWERDSRARLLKQLVAEEISP